MKDNFCVFILSHNRHDRVYTYDTLKEKGYTGKIFIILDDEDKSHHKYVGEGYVISNGGIALRYFNVYGPGEENKGKMASVAYQMFIKNIKGEKITLFPKKPQRDFVYIKDIVSANIHALKNYEELSGKYYEVGSGTARTFEDVLNNMGIEYGYTSEDVIPNGYQFYTCSDKSKWMNGWESKWDLEMGIKDYKEYLKKK